MTANDNGSVMLELEGGVFVVERDADGNVVSQEEIDGKLVLQLVLQAIELSIKKLVDKP